MNFNCFFQTEESLRLQVWGNRGFHRWESGGAFGSDWSENRWYEGIMVISKENTKWYFFFKTYEVRDNVLPDFTHQSLFGEMTNMEVLTKCEQIAFASESSPFPFVQIARDFIPVVSGMPDGKIRIARGEDGWD